MTSLSTTRPDVTLLLDAAGVITEVTVASPLATADVDSWRGLPWSETVGDVSLDAVRAMIEGARSSGVSGFCQVTQRFPGGREIPMEYTTVRLGRHGALMAIGKSLQAVTELQRRLLATQKTMEQDYWKLKEVVSRFRLLFEQSTDAVILVRGEMLRIDEANMPAVRALGIPSDRAGSAIGREFLSEVASGERRAFLQMLAHAAEHGQAPAMLVHLTERYTPVMLRAFLMASQSGNTFMLQLTPSEPADFGSEKSQAEQMLDLVERCPDGFVVVDLSGVVHHANAAFLDLTQSSALEFVLGKRLGRWLNQPGSDAGVLLDSLKRHGTLRLFPTTLQGEFGSECAVEVSAAGSGGNLPKQFGVIIRDISHAARQTTKTAPVSSRSAVPLGQMPLRQMLKDVIGDVERRYILEALEQRNGNRTAAANLLGISRQSLHTKLIEYNVEDKSRED